LALAILRLMAEEARKERTAKVICQLPLDVGNYLLNEKRDWVQTIQENNSVAVVIIANPDLETPNYSIRRVRDDEAALPENSGVSYKLVTPKEDPSLPFEEIKRPAQRTEAAVGTVLRLTPAPQPPPEPLAPPPPAAVAPGLLDRLFGWLKPVAAPPAAPAPAERPRRESRQSRGRDRDRDRARDRGDREPGDRH